MLSLLLCLLQAPAAEKPLPESPRLGGFQSEQRDLAEPSAALFTPDGGLVIVEAHAGRVRGAGLELDGLFEPRGLALADDGSWFVSVGEQLLRVRGTSRAIIALNSDADARPEGLAVTADALYVADSLAHCVRVIDPGTGAELHRIGTRGSNAGELLGPRDVAVSPAGEVYVADTGNHRVQVFAKNGAALRSFGSYGPYPGLFSSPSGLDWAIDSLWVADTGNHRIQRFNAAGEFLYGFGAHSIRPRDGAGRLHYPSQLAVAPDGKRIAIVEGFENRVQIFGEETAQSRLMELQNELSSSSHYGGALALSGRLCTVLEPESANAVALDTSGLDPVEITRIGRFGDKPDLFARPTAAAVDGEREELYFADSLRARISCFSVQRRSDEPLRYDLMLPRLVRARSTLELGFEPRALARHADGRLFVLGSNGSLWRTTASLERFEALLPADRERAFASAIAIDAAGERLAIANPAHHRIELCSSGGADLRTLTLGADAKQPARPAALAWTPAGTLLIADELRHDLCEIDASGRELRRIGRMGLARGEFYKPRALALDASGRTWVLDAGNHRVQILSPAGEFVHAFGSRLFIDPLLKGFQAPAPGDWESWPSVSSARMGWRIHYRASSWPPAVGETLTLEAVLVPLGAGAKEPRLVLDGAMPEHGHGLARDTRATRLEAPRPDTTRWRFEGLRLHMGGRWRLYFDVHTDGAVERAEWEVVLE